MIPGIILVAFALCASIAVRSPGEPDAHLDGLAFFSHLAVIAFASHRVDLRNVDFDLDTDNNNDTPYNPPDVTPYAPSASADLALRGPTNLMVIVDGPKDDALYPPPVATPPSPPAHTDLALRGPTDLMVIPAKVVFGSKSFMKPNLNVYTTSEDVLSPAASPTLTRVPSSSITSEPLDDITQEASENTMSEEPSRVKQALILSFIFFVTAFGFALGFIVSGALCPISLLKEIASSYSNVSAPSTELRLAGVTDESSKPTTCVVRLTKAETSNENTETGVSSNPPRESTVTLALPLVDGAVDDGKNDSLAGADDLPSAADSEACGTQKTVPGTLDGGTVGSIRSSQSIACALLQKNEEISSHSAADPDDDANVRPGDDGSPANAVLKLSSPPLEVLQHNAIGTRNPYTGASAAAEEERKPMTTLRGTKSKNRNTLAERDDENRAVQEDEGGRGVRSGGTGKGKERDIQGSDGTSSEQRGSRGHSAERPGPSRRNALPTLPYIDEQGRAWRGPTIKSKRFILQELNLLPSIRDRLAARNTSF